MESPPKEEEAGQPLPGERQTRLSGAWTALVIGVVILIVILVFILQNLQSVEVHFLMFQGHLPLAIALLFAMVLGAVVVLAFGAGRILQLRLVARRARHQGAHEPPPAQENPLAEQKRPREG
jgi:putative membrane protein